ncbi:exonuclease domain-containing protein [Bacillus sp. CECT 9360]|uniref:exonuclease domain-containing protein n=1 Tax=Bacillus sp. CECT 9360 TaxID=2845821 RepID=UPI001E53BAC3|nr:exonuclease domain-containing protein [Bacillus sp. CECT 9360]CAH0346048.1 3'-5' exonuclease DinG [Bacillus sp. CECT 9360]
MNYIIVDVERNSFNYETDKPSEIIEIGAVKLNQDGEMIDSFSSFIKPSCALSRFTIKLTQINEDMIKDAPTFKECYRDFVTFLGEDYIFVSWGKEDYRFFEVDCIRNDTDIFIPASFMDIQEVLMYGVLKTFNTPSLSSALTALEIDENANSHRALSDAESTAKIFIALNNMLDIHSVQKPKRDAKVLYFIDGNINRSGKKKYVKLINSVMKKTGNLHLSWFEFKSHPKWVEFKDDFQIDSVLEKNYEKQFEKYKTNIINSIIQKQVKSV